MALPHLRTRHHEVVADVALGRPLAREDRRPSDDAGAAGRRTTPVGQIGVAAPVSNLSWLPGAPLDPRRARATLRSSPRSRLRELRPGAPVRLGSLRRLARSWRPRRHSALAAAAIDVTFSVRDAVLLASSWAASASERASPEPPWEAAAREIAAIARSIATTSLTCATIAPKRSKMGALGGMVTCARA